MGEIIFRGWNRIVNRYSEEFTLEELYNTKGVQFQNLDFEQYTGITDEKGNKIFEGDIVRLESWSPSDMQIKFIEGAFCLCHLEKGHYVGDIHYVQHAGRKQSIVIGDIHGGVKREYL